MQKERSERLFRDEQRQMGGRVSRMKSASGPFLTSMDELPVNRVHPWKEKNRRRGVTPEETFKKTF